MLNRTSYHGVLDTGNMEVLLCSSIQKLIVKRATNNEKQKKDFKKV